VLRAIDFSLKAGDFWRAHGAIRRGEMPGLSGFSAPDNARILAICTSHSQRESRDFVPDI
jgi:hypothetical protein